MAVACAIGQRENSKSTWAMKCPILKNLHNPEFNKWAAKLFKGVKVGKDDPSYESALRIAQIPDDYIRALVGVYGPKSREENDKLADIVIARRDAIGKAYGIEP